MSGMESLRQWSIGLKQILAPALHAHLVNALAAMSFAMSLCGSCHSLRIASLLPGKANPASVRRRLERLLDNDHLHVQQVYAKLCAALAERRRSRRLVLIVDETSRDQHLRSLRVLAAVKRRCLPLSGIAYPTSAAPMPIRKLLCEQLIQVGQWLAGYDLKITLLADRGLAWPALLKTCQSLGWHYVLRVQGQTRFKDQAQQQMPIASLLAGKALGDCVKRQGCVFKKARWLACHVTAIHERGCKSPWFLISDQPAGFERVRRYCQRMWCEQSFRDEKSGGFCWKQSRVNDPSHATRLLVIMALAMWLCLLSGLAIVRRGWRRQLDCHAKRTLSYFKLGMLWLRAQLVRDPQHILVGTVEAL